jgi:hypothetical protein
MDEEAAWKARPAVAGLRPARDQRFEMYIVISMPNRKSMAAGVSHFIRNSPWSVNRRPG